MLQKSEPFVYHRALMAAEPEPPEREFAAAVLRRRCDALLEEAAALVDAPREDSVHDTRVQSRRLRAALEAFEDLLPPRPARALYDAARAITRALGRPRETGVALALLEELPDTGDPAEKLCREYLAERLRKKLRKQEKRLKRRLKASDLARLRSRVEDLLGAASRRETPRTAPCDGGRTIQRARRIFGETARPLLEFDASRDFAGADDERLHALRIAAKKLRYAMEVFDPAWPGGLEEAIARARALQDVGGIYHDWSVLCTGLEKEIGRLERNGSPGLAAGVGRIAALARERKAQLRQEILPALAGLQATLRKLRIRAKRAGGAPPARSGGRTK